MGGKSRFDFVKMLVLLSIRADVGLNLPRCQFCQNIHCTDNNLCNNWIHSTATTKYNKWVKNTGCMNVVDCICLCHFCHKWSFKDE